MQPWIDRVGAGDFVSRSSAATVLSWFEQGARVACALLVSVEGSAPLSPGAAMFIHEDGRLEGSITGGCVESAAATHAFELMNQAGPARLESFGISDDLAGDAGLMCGGTVSVFVSEVKTSSCAAVEAVLKARIAQQPYAIATLLDGTHAGARRAVINGASHGTLGHERLDLKVDLDARGLLTQGLSGIRRYRNGGTGLGSDVGVHIASIAERPRLVIIGASDFSAAVLQLADFLGFRVTICDPRRTFLDSPRFQAPARKVVAWPHTWLATQALTCRDAVLVVSHDRRVDVPAIEAALRTDASYIGVLGSRRTAAQRECRLRERGLPEDQLSRIHSPCGLDIGSATPEETALSILAEITAARNARSGGPLRYHSGRIRAAGTPQPRNASAIR